MEKINNKQKMVYVCHALTGDMEKNVKDINRELKEIHTENVIPVAPYMTTIQYLDNGTQEGYCLGMDANLIYINKGFVDEIWVCGDKLTNGMKEEIALAHECKVPVHCRNPSLFKSVIEFIIGIEKEKETKEPDVKQAEVV